MSVVRLVALALPVALLWSCSCSSAPPEPRAKAAVGADAPKQPAPAQLDPPAELGTCPRVGPARPVGTLTDPELGEISGMVASARQPGVLFVHNDSGDSARFFALDPHARKLAEFRVPGFWFDCEAMAAGPSADGDVLYFADIGDNLSRSRLGLARREVAIHRLLEPDLPAQGQDVVTLGAAATLRFRYPDHAHDAEVLLVDPLSSDMYLVTKEARGRSLVFRGTLADGPGAVQTLQLVAELAFGSAALPGSREPTAGDIARSGSAILIRTYSTTFLWRRTPGTSVADALRAKPLALPTPTQPQAEAVAFSADGRGYFTTSEQDRQPLYWVGCE